MVAHRYEIFFGSNKSVYRVPATLFSYFLLPRGIGAPFDLATQRHIAEYEKKGGVAFN